LFLSAGAAAPNHFAQILLFLATNKSPLLNAKKQLMAKQYYYVD